MNDLKTPLGPRERDKSHVSSVMFAGLSVSGGGNASDGQSTHSTTTGSIRYYHVISVGVICFLIGAITSFVVLIHCQRITPTAFNLPLDHKPSAAAGATASAAAAAAVSPATKRRDVMVTSRGGRGGASTLQSVTRTSSINSEKLRRTSNDVFSPATAAARSPLSNGGCGGGSQGQTALVHLRQYYRRHYTGGVADSNYRRT